MTKYLAVASGTVILCLLLLSAYLSVRLDAVKFEAKQNRIAYDQCVESSQIAKEVSYEYQSEISNLNRRLRDVRRMLADACVPVDQSSDGRNATSADGELRRANGVPASRILDIAESAERVRLRLISCQKYLTKIQ